MKICDLEPSEIEIAMSYMDGVHYNKPNQPEFSRGSSSKKSNIEKSADRAGTSGNSLILLADASIGQDRVTDDDDDFVDPPPRCQESSPYGKPHTDEGTSAAPRSPNEPPSEGTHLGDVSQISSHISLFSGHMSLICGHIYLFNAHSSLLQVTYR
jgi:hypothetical protein